MLSRRPAGFWIRAAAYVIDAVILGIVGGLLASFGLHTTASDPRTGGPSLVLSVIYFGLLWSSVGGGQTVGMRLLGLRVVGKDGRLIGLGASLLRWFMLIVSFFVCFIGVIWVAFDSQKRGWHDIVARTYVEHT